jgi:hypothetical protein
MTTAAEKTTASVIKIQQPPIPGGFILKARKIDHSAIAHKAPAIREIWDWILRQCNHKENLSLNIKRGQCVRRIADIQEGLHWYIGYRKKLYSKTQCEHALEFLRKTLMITTSKTTRGMLITVCNYDSYQTIENYEYNSEGGNKTTIGRQQGDTINKNDKNINNGKEERLPVSEFYLKEIEACKDQAMVSKYKTLVDYLHGSNDEDLVFVNVLKMPQQLTYGQYLKLREKAAAGVDLREILMSMENTPKSLRDKKSLYLTLNNWAGFRQKNK